MSTATYTRFGNDTLMAAEHEPAVAVLIPCRNEEATVAEVVRQFRAALPGASVWVFDNASHDSTAVRAKAAGAVVMTVPLPGKGNVVRRMFADVEADLYLLVDGDGTYDANSAPKMLRAITEQGADMVIAVRREVNTDSFRRGHRFGNRLLTGFLAWLFGRRSGDVLSGYRAFSRRFVKSFPTQSEGFEIETELTVHGLQGHMPVVEIDTPYHPRPADSFSKLSTWRDGWRILRTMLALFSAERPLMCFGLLASGLAAVSLALGIPVVIEWLQTGLVPRVPTAVLSAAMMTLSALAFFSGLILDTVTRGRREFRMLAYLAHRAPDNRHFRNGPFP